MTADALAGVATRGKAARLDIVLVGPLPPPAGGMANQTEQLARLLGADGHAVRVVRTNAPYRLSWAGRVPVLRALVRLLPYLLSLWRELRGADVVHVMANSGWSWHLFAAPAVWLAWLRGVRSVVNYRGGEAAPFLARSARIVAFTLRRTAALIVPSGFLQEVFAAHGIHADVVPNVVDLARFAPTAQRGDSGAPHLVVTRHLEAIYDVATALRAFAQVRQRWPDAQLTVAGRGPERAALERLAGDLGVAAAVRFVGNVTLDEIRALYARADLMLNASRVDNMPNALLEALASGLPVVSTRAGGIPYIVEDGQTALLVDVGNADALAAAAARVLAEPALAQRLRTQGLAAVRRYTWDSVRERLFSVYRSRDGEVLQESLS
ncbi:MAG: glycosyltransferase family 4 protein [Burkholderiaceae bacterium]|jgi:glycosyltransferase involved in cell wall biosynthesis|nr:glycosyltransferase family 4 protein [Burkholderiaceae bacterium]